MRAPRLDLHRPNRPDAVAGLIALVLGIVAVIAAMQYRDALKEQGDALDERESLIAKKEAKFRSISQARRGGGDTRAAMLMAQQRYAAEPARDLIEGGWNPNIAFLSIDITTASRQINMQFETRSVQEALSYADWFQEQPGTESVSVKRQTQKAEPPAKSVETALQVTWKPFVAKPLASEPTEREVEASAASTTPVVSNAPAASEAKGARR
ncbi:hypothetical protein BVER_01386 [Candidatus Burkholderia verschuerenii]|uniref:Uncharacterized protein n=1 Tax=Candidatus Burkholderia verschuerenii TaxID=242163 RepID=A0A0L0MB58_9BURK|nr:hypothetical protein [Candidatus Burkholderia verschuerenii]KND59506.1 hypothetical protein BVER_01386 [Candidatus Burkholderia verschuerenii]